MMELDSRNRCENSDQPARPEGLHGHVWSRLSFIRNCIMAMFAAGSLFSPAHVALAFGEGDSSLPHYHYCNIDIDYPCTGISAEQHFILI